MISFLLGLIVTAIISVIYLITMICSKNMILFFGGSLIGFIAVFICGMYFLFKDMNIG